MSNLKAYTGKDMAFAIVCVLRCGKREADMGVPSPKPPFHDANGNDDFDSQLQYYIDLCDSGILTKNGKFHNAIAGWQKFLAASKANRDLADSAHDSIGKALEAFVAWDKTTNANAWDDCGYIRYSDVAALHNGA